MLLAFATLLSIAASACTVSAQATYNGGYNSTSSNQVLLRIGNGGAGQSGLIGAWANAFIQYMVQKNGTQPFLVQWVLGDTTQSLNFLAAGSIDVAVTYNDAAETQALSSGAAVSRVYGFRDHFLLVGPQSNPAGINQTDDILVMINKIVATGNADLVTPPTVGPPTRFLSRFDKSATNIKESQLFITIGQVPWAFAYSTWYHQYPVFPLQALAGASLLSEYTLTDRGTWLSSPASVTTPLTIFKAGSDNATDLLLNPAHVLLGKNTTNAAIAQAFMTWVVDPAGGQQVIANFTKNGQVLYSQAPVGTS